MIEKKDRIRHFGIMMAGICFVSVCLYIVLNEVKRYQLIKKNERLLNLAHQELAYLSVSGTNNRTVDYVRAEQNVLQAEREIAQLKSRWKILTLSTNSEQHEKIQRLIQINKELIANYQQEIQDLLHAGLSLESERVVFIQSKMVQAQANLVELGKKLESFTTGEHKQEQEKIKQLLSLHRKSINMYQQEIADYRKLGVAENDPKIRFARDQITEKNDEILRLEHLL